ncbi:putative hydrolase [Helianthus annuus]|nr:putative hydrolase [Helianthus annuus]
MILLITVFFFKIILSRLKYINCNFFNQWMPVEEYAKQPFVKKHKSFDYIAKICIAKKDNKYVGFSPLLTTTASSAKKS